MKRIISLFLAAILAVGILLSIRVGAEKYGDYEYKVLDDGNVQLTKYTGSGGSVEIPAEIDGKAVTDLSFPLFRANDTVISIKIPESVTKIGSEFAARCANLETINVPKNVKSVPGDFIKECPKITSVTIPDGVEEIGGAAFYMCFALTSINIPSSVKSIGARAFFRCGVWEDASNWDGDSLYIDDCLIIVSNTKVSGVYTVDPGTRLIAAQAFYGANQLTKVVIPDSVEYIGSSAFRYCSAMTDIVMNGAIREIEKYTYEDCTGLVSVTVPANVTIVGDEAFKGCTNLSSITFEAPRIDMGSKVLENTAYFDNAANWDGDLLYLGNVLMAAKPGIVDLVVKEGTAIIASRIFWSYAGIKTVRLPVTLKTLCFGSFYDLTTLEKMVFAGTEEAWNKVTGSDERACAFNAYYVTKEFLGMEAVEPEYAITVIYGAADREKAKEGDIVTVTADLYTTVKFDHWTADKFDFSSNPTYREVTASFKMPASDVKIEAVYVEYTGPDYTVTVEGGSASVSSAKEGMQIIVTAAEKEGFKFDHWDSYDFRYPFESCKYEISAFIMPACDVTVRAVFIDLSVTKPGDVNGDGKLNAKDVTWLMKYLVGAAPSGFVLESADYDLDGKINAKDVTKLMKYLVSL